MRATVTYSAQRVAIENLSAQLRRLDICEPDRCRPRRSITSLRVNRSSGQPSLYQPITLLRTIGREPRMVERREMERFVRELLECY